jgi:hypothetical protein
MANSFSLTRKIDIDNGPVSLRQIDEEICAHQIIIIMHGLIPSVLS